MSKRIFGMAPGGRMNLDRAVNRRRNVWYSAKIRAQKANERPARSRERKGGQEDG